MPEVTTIIPNYNGKHCLEICLPAMMRQTLQDMELLVVDNGSSDGSVEWLAAEYPQIQVLSLPDNQGFCGAVNQGVRQTRTPYVILLNNDTEPEPAFVETLLTAIKQDERLFSCQAKMLDYYHRELMDDAGDFYCALGWSFARGKGRPQELYAEPCEIFASCAGAAIYNTALFQELGALDEAHFAYLEDMDLGYRARICGYKNKFVPEARVYHMGSATSGSKHNQWKVRLSARNSLYLAYKNMPWPQLLLNSPLILLGILVKGCFFTSKGFGKPYWTGVRQGFGLCRKCTAKVPWRGRPRGTYWKIQLELWQNIVRRLRKS